MIARNKKIVIIAAIVVLAVLFFYPKQMSYTEFGGFAGFIGNTSAIGWEYSCLGMAYNSCPENCADCGCTKQCLGITYDKKCFNESYSQGVTSIERIPTECK